MKKKTERERIMDDIAKLHREQGIAFLSHDDAVDYFRKLVELVERWINKNKK